MPEILSVLRWSLSLGAKFSRVVPFLTLAIVVLSLVAQIASLLSFFLPLKIIILLGSEGMPRYFPPAFFQIDRDLLIASLSGATVGFFLLSLLADKLIEKATAVAAGKLLGKSQKMVLFENQEDIAAKAYQRYSGALAAGVFIPLALFALGWFYPSMAVLIAGYSLLVFVVFFTSYRISETFREYLDQKLGAALGLAGNLGFFVVFAYLVVEFIFFSPPGFIIAIISMLASRQVFGRAKALVTGLHGLGQQRPRLDALFFHGKVLSNHEPVQRKKNLWSLIDPEARKSWLGAILKEAGIQGWATDQLQVSWLNSSQPNMPHLLVSHYQEPGQHYLVKLFDTNRKSLAQHEGTLATERPDRLPIPDLLLATEVNRFPCQVYKVPSGRVLKPGVAKSKVPELTAQLLTLDLPAGLVGRYRRSRPLLGDRLTPELMERLYVACDDRKDTLRVAEFVERFTEIQLLLRGLPLVLVNPRIKNSIWMKSDDESLTVLNWDKWSLEPLGAGWPVVGKKLNALTDCLSEAAKERRKLAKVAPESAQLAALVFELERLINKQQLLAALGLLPRILNKLNALEKIPKD